MRAMHSIQRRVAGTVLLMQLLAAALLCAAVLHHELEVRLHAQDVQLQGRADSLLGAVQDAEDPGDNVRVDPEELRLPPEDTWAVYNRDSQLMGSSGRVVLPLAGSEGFRNQRVHGHILRVFEHHALRIIDRAETGGAGLHRPVVILYAVPRGEVYHQVWEAARFDLIAVVAVSTLAVAAVLTLLRRALRPVEALAHAAAGITLPGLHFSAPADAHTTHELRPLADALTRLVQRLREAFRKEQQFVGDAAHELKTAVAVVRSTVQVLMLRQRTQAEYAAGLERVLEDNDRVETLVQQMLSLTRSEESAQPQDRCDLTCAVEDAVRTLQSLAERGSVHVQQHCEAGTTVAVPADRAAVLVINLLANAIQHSSPHSTVDVSCRREGNSAVLAVVDQGCGISPEHLPHVRERFYRADPSRSRQTGGTGLGLAICDGIVQRAGGALTLASRVGEGTTVTATFTLL